MHTDPANYPRLAARTQRFTLGVPRSFTVSPDGQRLVFLRSSSGTDRSHRLWVFDVRTATERLVADPALLLTEGVERLSSAERARRERLREGGGGIVGYATDQAVRIAAFALSSRLFVADLVEGGVREIPTPAGVVDPRPDPTGRRIAYVSGHALRVVTVGGTDDRDWATPLEPQRTVGLAEFVAAEEMGRSRGYWWAPDGESLLAAEVDESEVEVWHIANPAEPATTPQELRYPAAGTANAAVTLWHITSDGQRREVVWDRTEYPYLARVSWPKNGTPLLLVQSRDQRVTQVREINVHPGEPSIPTLLLQEDRDESWLELVPGSPTRLADGRLVTTRDMDDTRRLVVGETPVSPIGQQVRAVLDTEASAVLVAACDDDPTQVHLSWIGADGSVRPVTSAVGVHSGRSAGGTTVVTSRLLDDAVTRVTVLSGGAQVAEITSLTVEPPVRPAVRLLSLGRRGLRAALLLPTGHVPGSARLPVLVDPYGGPGAQRVLSARGAYLEAQWWADEGFAVLIVDGRGTPGRGPAWEREIQFDFAGPVLADQVEGLRAAAEEVPDLDLNRVAIRGWSFGGYLAALAVLRRPDVFHAAVAGAPVTDWRLYDTHYTERYLGHPAEHPRAYEDSSLLNDATGLERPLLLIHGLADDNVVAAHTLRLSRALLEAGRAHQVLPLSGVTHFTPQEVVAENLLRLQVDFLKTALPK